MDAAAPEAANHGSVPHDVDELPIAWREAGPVDGDLVVLFHGLGGSRTAWEPQLRALATAGYRAAAWDAPGYGRSGPPATDSDGSDPNDRDTAEGWTLTWDGLVAAAAGWIERLGATSAHVVGLSFGGMVAQHLALQHPELVRSLSLVDTSPAFGLDGTTTAESWVAARLAPLLAGSTPAAMADRVLRGIAGPAVSDAVIAEATAAMSRVSSAGLAGAVRCLPTHDTRDRLASLRGVVRAQVLVGELDEETPRSYAQTLAGGLDAPLHVVAGAGHLANLEAPDAVDALLIDFLGS